MNRMESRAGSGLPPLTALITILMFWTVHTLAVALQQLFSDEGFGLQVGVRGTVASIVGIISTWTLYLILRLFRSRPLAVKLISAFTLPAFFAVFIAIFNYYILNVHSPDLMDTVHNSRNLVGHKYDVKIIIFESALTYYFFLSAWSTLFFAISNSYDALRNERRVVELQASANDAEIRALRYQVNPHFLFNTLNSISTLIMKDDKHRADTMIVGLGSFYKTSLAINPVDDISLEEEVKLQETYLDIEKVRFPGRLRTIIDIPPALKSTLLPSLILQPLVENAIKHGVSKSSNLVTISIGAGSLGDMIFVSVKNDALTSDGSDLVHTGIGLTNVVQRLKARFGKRAAADFVSMGDEGYSATLWIPAI